LFNSLLEEYERKIIPLANVDKHVNEVNPNIIAFYLRTDAFDSGKKGWVPLVPEVKNCALEITAVEPETGEILYLPLRLELDTDQLQQWVQGDRTTIVDVELLRLPSPKVFMMVSY
jgi:hypothetical protein